MPFSAVALEFCAWYVGTEYLKAHSLVFQHSSGASLQQNKKLNLDERLGLVCLLLNGALTYDIVLLLAQEQCL